MKYTAEQILLAAQLGEVSEIDAQHIISQLPKVVQVERNKEKQCTCLPYGDGQKWFLNDCKLHG